MGGRGRACRSFYHPRALPALFFGGVFPVAAGFAEVLAAFATGARALLVDSDLDSDLGLGAAFLAAAFTGFGTSSASALASASVAFLAGFFADFFAGAFGFAAAFFFALPPPLAARSSSSAIASGRVMVSLSLSPMMVALTPPAVT